MGAFFVRRLLSGLLLIGLLTFLTFVVFNEIPTNPACLVVACGPHTTTTDAQIRAADHRLGIDRSVFVQYGDFAWRLVRHGDFGTAWTSQSSVGTLIGQALPVTASLVSRRHAADPAARAAPRLRRGAATPLADGPRPARRKRDRARDPSVRPRNRDP